MAVCVFYVDFRSTLQISHTKQKIKDTLSSTIRTFGAKASSPSDLHLLTDAENEMLNSIVQSSASGLMSEEELQEERTSLLFGKNRNDISSQAELVSDNDSSPLMPRQRGLSTDIIRAQVKSLGHTVSEVVSIGREKLGRRKKDELEKKLSEMMDQEEVVEMLEPSVFKTWVEANLVKDHELMLNALSLYVRVNNAVREAVSDSSHCSVYASNSSAIFYSKLVDAYPYMLDALLNATDESAKEFDKLVKFVSEAEAHYGENGSLSKLVVSIDRGALLHFLVEEADHDSRRALNELLMGMRDELHNKGKTHFMGRFSPIVRFDTSASLRPGMIVHHKSRGPGTIIAVDIMRSGKKSGSDKQISVRFAEGMCDIEAASEKVHDEWRTKRHSQLESDGATLPVPQWKRVSPEDYEAWAAALPAEVLATVYRYSPPQPNNPAVRMDVDGHSAVHWCDIDQPYNYLPEQWKANNRQWADLTPKDEVYTYSKEQFNIQFKGDAGSGDKGTKRQAPGMFSRLLSHLMPTPRQELASAKRYGHYLIRSEKDPINFNV